MHTRWMLGQPATAATHIPEASQYIPGDRGQSSGPGLSELLAVPQHKPIVDTVYNEFLENHRKPRNTFQISCHTIPPPHTVLPLTCTPSLALPLTVLMNSADVRAAWTATSNAPAPGITQPTARMKQYCILYSMCTCVQVVCVFSQMEMVVPSSMLFFTALSPSRTASLI